MSNYSRDYEFNGQPLEKNASNQSGGTLSGDTLVAGSYVGNTYGYSSKKTTRTTTTVREYNDQGNLVKETETVVEVEENPSYGYPSYPYTFNQYVQPALLAE